MTYLFKMMQLLVVISGFMSTAAAFQTLFPDQNKLFNYEFKVNVTTRTLFLVEEGSFWTLEGGLAVQVYDNCGRARFVLENFKTLVQSKADTSSFEAADAVQYLKTPWEVGVCFTSIHVDSEPVWVTNIKRAISFNFLLAETRGSSVKVEEPCLQGNCIAIYSRLGNRIKKYYSQIQPKTRPSMYEQRCLPNRMAEAYYRQSYSEDANYFMTVEREYILDEKIGLKSLEMKSDFQYRTKDHILSVLTELSVRYENSFYAQNTRKLNLTETSLQYVSHSSSEPTNGIWHRTQEDLKNITYQTLMEIAKKGIDADIIVRKPALVHSLDFINLLNTMSQLNYTSLKKVFIDILGTSYELETSRNIFLEVLPYVRTDACAKLIRHLVIEQKTKIEDGMLVSLIRKLPFNIAHYSTGLLQELEVFTKLGPDFPQEIRHAGILSFSTLVWKTMEVAFDQQYFDDIYDKYLRMYNYCPEYADRLVWLHGLSNIGKSVVNCLDEIHIDSKKDRHERFWAALASLSLWKGSTLENTIAIFTNESEHIQLRVVALHALLSSSLGSAHFMSAHNYVMSCNNEQLKKFWYSTVKNLENNRFFHRYKSASYYIPFVANQVRNPGPQYWATTNYLVSQQPSLDAPGPAFQLLTLGEEMTGPPEFIMMEFSTGGEQTFSGALYIIAEGMTTNIFNRIQIYNTTKLHNGDLLKMLQNMKVSVMDREHVHIDIVLKIHGSTVYTAHIDKEKFNTWNLEDLKNTVEDFVRLGSHINQQMVYYPVQFAKDLPTEIGTPVRMQSSIVSFTSIRGNLTASSDDLTWKNDLHIRHHGTSVVSLSTDGPLQPSQHTVRLQQSMAVHLPIKIDLGLSLAAKSLELKWINPSQNGGIAMHSRTQIETSTKNGTYVLTVTTGKNRTDDGIYFDCERPMSGSQISQLLTFKSHNILNSLQPSHIIVNLVQLLTTPTPGPCGLIFPPFHMRADNIVEMEIKVEEVEWKGIDSEMKAMLKMSFNLKHYIKEPKRIEELLVIKGRTIIKSSGRDGSIELELNRWEDDPNFLARNWTICLKEEHRTESSLNNILFDMSPSDFRSEITLDYSTNPQFSCFSDAFLHGSDIFRHDSGEQKAQLYFRYSKPSVGTEQGSIELKLRGRNLMNSNLDCPNLLEEPFLVTFLNNMFEETPLLQYYSKAVVTENNGTTSIDINITESTLRPNFFHWLPDSWMNVQTLKDLGFYHKCRVQETEVQTFSGAIIKIPHNASDLLLVGHCIDEPRFLILSSEDKQTVRYYTEEGITIYPERQTVSNKTKNKKEDSLKEKERKVKEIFTKSPLTKVYINKNMDKYNEIVIEMPHLYMNNACGACVGQIYDVNL